VTLLQVFNIVKNFNHEPALKGVDLNVAKGEILCLLGPSGCGKTTLLRIIAGLEQPDKGQVVFDGNDMARVMPHHRQFGMMFQEFALFPHKTVFENVAFGLQMQHSPDRDIRARTNEVLSLVGLDGKGLRRVDELSGGERQRVALARSIAPNPRLLMLDEPMGSLDRALRERLVQDLRKILKKLGVTAVFVTHDQAEAFAVADRIAVFNAGRIEQVDTPETLYKNPATNAVARFLGFQNLIPGTVIGKGRVKTEIGTMRIDTGPVPVHQELTVLIRPEGARMPENRAGASESVPAVSGRISDCFFQGSVYRLTLVTESGRSLTFFLPNYLIPPRAGRKIQLAIDSEAVVLVNA
jgi:ABC-type Fe3+/spermidine/putrescine transport system ATPase subunit